MTLFVRATVCITKLLLYLLYYLNPFSVSTKLLLSQQFKEEKTLLRMKPILELFLLIKTL